MVDYVIVAELVKASKVNFLRVKYSKYYYIPFGEAVAAAAAEQNST
jgi:hypothetical protein